MKIVKERTRLIFSEYTEADLRDLKQLVSTIDNTFIYEDEMKHLVYLPVGIQPTVEKTFRLPVADHSTNYWQPASIADPIGQPFEPRNQMQTDSIEFTMRSVKRERKVGLILPPGSGKTYVASYCAVKTGLRTLIIAPTTGVRDQWADSLISMVKVDPKRVRTISSTADLISFDGDFAVTLQSTLSGMIKKLDLERLLRDKRFGTKIIDEAHMFFNNIIRVDGSCNFKNNWYLTATFGRSNEEEDELYHRMFGDIDLFRVKDKKPTIFNRKPGDIYGQKPHMNVTVCWLNGGLNREQIGSVAGATRYGISLPKYTDLIIPADGTRTKFVDKLIKIVHLADKQADYGRTLILVPTINSVETVADHLRKEFPNRKIGTIHSKNDKAANDRVKAEDEIIISTVKSSGTGFDVKDLAKLIVAEQFKSAILAEQVSGRLRRRPDGKDTYMYDIVDRSVRQLRVWGAARSQFLKRKSKKFTVTNM